MATASNPVQQPAKPPKHEAFVEDQLQKVRSRIGCSTLGRPCWCFASALSFTA